MSDAHRRWSERLARYDASGQTVVAFCADEGVSTPSFYLWKRKLADTPLLAANPPSPLVPIQLTSAVAATTPSIELVLPSGILLRLPTDYPLDQLATLLTSVEARSC